MTFIQVFLAFLYRALKPLSRSSLKASVNQEDYLMQDGNCRTHDKAEQNGFQPCSYCDCYDHCNLLLSGDEGCC